MNYSMDPSASQILSAERINAQTLYGILRVFMIQRIQPPELNLDIIVSSSKSFHITTLMIPET